MQYALTRDSRKLVKAESASRLSDYRCPTCEGGVYLVRGEVQIDHFRHLPNEGTLACENYFPSNYLTNPAYRDQEIAVEDSPEEVGLGLEIGSKKWMPFLRVPEIRNSELGAFPLKALQFARIVVLADGDVVEMVSGLDLLPRTGTARIRVPPVSARYQLALQGEWPKGVSAERWRTYSRGLDSAGTLFRMHRGEWTRLRERSYVEWGEKLCVVANEGLPPPPQCAPTAISTITSKRTNWAAWTVELPSSNSDAVVQWLQGIGIDAVEPSWKITLVSIPLEMAEDGTPVYQIGDPVVARLKAPDTINSAPVVLSGAGNTSKITCTSRDGNSFVSVNAGLASLYTITAADHVESVISFQSVPAKMLEAIKTQLYSVPVLKLHIGDETAGSWGTPLTIRRDKLDPLPHIVIDLGHEEVDPYLSISWYDGYRIDMISELRLREATNQLTHMLGVPGTQWVRISAAALGTVEIRLARQLKTAVVHHDRSRRSVGFVAAALAAQRTDLALSPAYDIRKTTTVNFRLLSVATRNPRGVAGMMLRTFIRRISRNT